MHNLEHKAFHCCFKFPWIGILVRTGNSSRRVLYYPSIQVAVSKDSSPPITATSACVCWQLHSRWINMKSSCWCLFLLFYLPHLILSCSHAAIPAKHPSLCFEHILILGAPFLPPPAALPGAPFYLHHSLFLFLAIVCSLALTSLPPAHFLNNWALRGNYITGYNNCMEISRAIGLATE